MNSIPRPPRTLITHLITCICCHEQFVIAEDDPIHGSKWRVPTDQHSSTQFRYEEDLERAGVRPGARANSRAEAEQDNNQAHDEPDDSQKYYDLYCPRCGTDNRTWLHVTNSERPLPSSLAWIAGYIILILFALVVYFQPDPSPKQLVLLLAVWLMAGIFPFFMIPPRWRQNRDDNYLRRLGVRDRLVSPVLQTAVTMFAILVLLIPLLAFVLMPLAQTIFLAILRPFSETIVETADPDIGQNLAFFIDWIWYVGVTNIVSSTIAILAVNHMIARVDRQLPRPIFVSLALMRRVAIWESKRTLEIRFDLEEIQWMGAKRNEKGGITLNGIFRDPPDLLPNGRLNEKVRAQIYTIYTDPWCRITSATIKDYMAPRPAGGPGFVSPLPAAASTEEVTVSRRRY